MTERQVRIAMAVKTRKPPTEQRHEKLAGRHAGEVDHAVDAEHPSLIFIERGGVEPAFHDGEQAREGPFVSLMPTHHAG
jgi:hypothetical protein